MLDGASRVNEVVAAAAADGQPGIGITDHGNMYGVLPMYRAARDAGITPIIGTELYQAYEHRTERPARRGSQVDDSGGEVEGGRKAYYHLTALAENLTGYRNLIQLSSRAYLEGYYQKPKVDWELLENHHEGIIATTGCLGGQVLQALLQQRRCRRARGRRAACRTSSGATTSSSSCRTTGSRISNGPTRSSSRSPRKVGAPLLVTNDSHYTHQKDAESHDALLCVQTGAKIHDEKRFRFHGDQHYLKTRGGDARPVRRGPRGVRQHALDRGARRDVELAFDQEVLPSSRSRRARPRTPTCASSRSRARRSATASRPSTACSSGSSTSSA